MSEKEGYVFRTYAPNAYNISVIGEFNNWQEEVAEQMYQSGVWTYYSKNAKEGQMYRYVIYGKNGRVVDKQINHIITSGQKTSMVNK